MRKTRQVIVFTHEAAFVNVLNKAARDFSVAVTEGVIRPPLDKVGESSSIGQLSPAPVAAKSEAYPHSWHRSTITIHR